MVQDRHSPVLASALSWRTSVPSDKSCCLYLFLEMKILFVHISKDASFRDTGSLAFNFLSSLGIVLHNADLYKVQNINLMGAFNDFAVNFETCVQVCRDLKPMLLPGLLRAALQKQEPVAWDFRSGRRPVNILSWDTAMLSRFNIYEDENRHRVLRWARPCCLMPVPHDPAVPPGTRGIPGSAAEPGRS